MAFIKNVMEEEVEYYIDQLRENGNICCSCAHCRLDIKALALNLLPPKYVTGHKGKVFSQVSVASGNTKTRIINAVDIANMTVLANPRHNS